MNTYYVYIYYDPYTNEPFYIGKGCKNRYLIHLTETEANADNKRKFKKIQNILKNGQHPIIHIVSKHLSENDAYDLEDKLIRQYGRIDFEKNGILTNICLGLRPPNRKGSKTSEYTKNLLREKLKGITLEQRYGKEKATQIKYEMSLRHKGKSFMERFGSNADNIKQKISKTLTGRPTGRTGALSSSKRLDVRQKISNTLKGNIPWNKGIKTNPLSPQSIKKRTDTLKYNNAKKHIWRIVAPDNNIYLAYGTLITFSEDLNLPIWTLTKMWKNENYKPNRGLLKNWQCKKLTEDQILLIHTQPVENSWTLLQ